MRCCTLGVLKGGGAEGHARAKSDKGPGLDAVGLYAATMGKRWLTGDSSLQLREIPDMYGYD